MPSLLDRFRSTGADLPFGDPLPAHGVASEGYFWRFSQPGTGRSLTVFVGVNRGADGPWSTVSFAAHPNGFVRTAAVPEGVADPHRLGAEAGKVLRADVDGVQVDLGPDAQLDVRITDRIEWPRRAFGGASFFQSIPGVAHRWHPWLFGGKVEGTAVVGGETWDLTGAEVYAEKRWGSGAFPEKWWCGQAQGFDDGTCVSFAGGAFTSGRIRIETTLVVIRLPNGAVLRFGGPRTSHVRAHVDEEKFSLHGRSPMSGIEIEGSSPLDAAFVLPAPSLDDEKNAPAAIVHLGARMHVTLRRRAEISWSGESTIAALEYGGFERAREEHERRASTDPAAAPPVA